MDSVSEGSREQYSDYNAGVKEERERYLCVKNGSYCGQCRAPIFFLIDEFAALASSCCREGIAEHFVPIY